jgi:hypothetical protein
VWCGGGRAGGAGWGGLGLGGGGGAFGSVFWVFRSEAMRLLSKLRASCLEPTSDQLQLRAAQACSMQILGVIFLVDCFFVGLLKQHPSTQHATPRGKGGGASLCVFLIGLLLLRPWPRPQLPQLLGLPPPLWLRLADCAALGGASLLLLHPGVNTGVLRRLRQAS